MCLGFLVFIKTVSPLPVLQSSPYVNDYPVGILLESTTRLGKDLNSHWKPGQIFFPKPPSHSHQDASSQNISMYLEHNVSKGATAFAETSVKSLDAVKPESHGTRES